MINSNSPRIMFLRNQQNHPVGCLAISVDRKNQQLSYQYSVLNPIDRFNREMARVLALGRLVERPLVISCPQLKGLDMHTVSMLVMSHLADSNAPTRAVQAARKWLDQ